MLFSPTRKRLVQEQTDSVHPVHISYASCYVYTLRGITGIAQRKLRTSTETDYKVSVPVLLCAVFSVSLCFTCHDDCVDFQYRFSPTRHK